MDEPVPFQPKKPLLRTSYMHKKKVPGRGPGRPKGSRSKKSATVSSAAAAEAAPEGKAPQDAPQDVKPKRPPRAGCPFPHWPPDIPFKREENLSPISIRGSSEEDKGKEDEQEYMVLDEYPPQDKWDEGPPPPPSGGGATGIACS